MRLLAVDTGSPIASVAVVAGGKVAALRTLDRMRTSQSLLPAIEEAVAEAGLGLSELDGLVGVAGPGSFTGLRIGLATLLGFHQALALPATAVSTLAALAAAGAEAIGAAAGDTADADPPVAPGTAHAAVDALRGDLFVQSFSPDWPPRSLGEPRRVGAAELGTLAAGTLAGFDLADLVSTPTWPRHLRVIAAPPLAPAAARLAVALHGTPGESWSAAALTAPIYLAAPVGGGRDGRDGRGRG